MTLDSSGSSLLRHLNRNPEPKPVRNFMTADSRPMVRRARAGAGGEGGGGMARDGADEVEHAGI